jgi:hypothetical protein
MPRQTLFKMLNDEIGKEVVRFDNPKIEWWLTITCDTLSTG